MIFNYHPILGLQYYTFEDEIFQISIVPQNITDKTTKELIEEWRYWQKGVGIQFLDSSKPKIEELSLPIYSNF